MERSKFIIKFIDEEALNQFKDLPKSTQKMLGKAIKERLEIDPISYGKPLQNSLKGHRRLRVSSYRIVYKIDEVNKIVIILAADNRKNIYDQFN